MYTKVDEILEENSSDNYFYDDEFMYVQELLNDFTDADWDCLFEDLKDKNNKYKCRLAYCINEDVGVNGLNLLLKLFDEDDEVVEYVIDSLRSFNGEEYKAAIIYDKRILDKAEILFKNASLPVKQVLESFLKEHRK